MNKFIFEHALAQHDEAIANVEIDFAYAMRCHTRSENLKALAMVFGHQPKIENRPIPVIDSTYFRYEFLQGRRLIEPIFYANIEVWIDYDISTGMYQVLIEQYDFKSYAHLTYEDAVNDAVDTIEMFLA